MYTLLKPLLFLLTPEKAHHFALWALDSAWAIPPVRSLVRRLYATNKAVPVDCMGLRFPNTVGLAAGFDKDGKHILPLSLLGFGFIEVGTVTPRPQNGNPQPRLFRLPADQALINRMGFNNEGLDALVDRLKILRTNHPDLQVIIGGNIGKNKDTPNELAEQDYLLCFDKLYPWVDYFVVNVSSPNTPGLRALQEKEPLTRLLKRLQAQNKLQATSKPILLKIAPDLSPEQLDDIASIVLETNIAGVIASNTTIGRSGLQTPAQAVSDMGAGGLSGAPLRARSTEVVRILRNKLGSGPIIIGVGGIETAAHAQEKMEAGANLVQVYSGMVYVGPAIVRRVLG
ncbi:MAG: quinone-dependent dihydroorotate dehydrogenase [Saprospiraceae bacterium]